MNTQTNNQNYHLTFADFYAGIGGFRLGLEEIGWNCTFTNENNHDCIKTYNLNFNDSVLANNIEDLQLKEIPDFDVFCGGFPCQPFSIAGKRKGFHDSRGQAITNILAICNYKKPKAIFIENVRHIINLDKGQILKQITDSLKQNNYIPFYSIIDSKFFKVPQSRPRFFMIAFRKDLGISSFNFPNPTYPEVNVGNIIEKGDYSIPISSKWHEYIDYYAGRIDSKQLSFVLPKTRITLERVDHNVDYDNCIYQIRSSGIRAISVKRPFPTLAVSASGGGAMIPVYTKERRHLSLLEIQRLMGFPDHFSFPVSRTSAIKQLANSVCPSVIKHIGMTISELLS